MIIMSSLTLLSMLNGCFAYVGPGPGLSMLGAFVGLLATVLVCVWAIGLWPVRALLRQWRKKRTSQTN